MHDRVRKGAIVLGLLIAAPAAAQTRWTVEPAPVLTLTGHREPFHRIVGATTLPDGTLAVGDAGARRVWFFAASGTPRGEFGRDGSGPGEFRLMTWLGRCVPDGVSVFDAIQARITDVSGTGALIATRPGRFLLGPPATARVVVPHGLACAPNGTHVAVAGPRGMSPTPGPYRPQVPIGVSRDGLAFTLIGHFPGAERHRFATTEGPRLFGRQTLVAATPTRVFVGTADSFFVQLFDHDGTPREALRHPVPEKPVTAADREVEIQRTIERARGRASESDVRTSRASVPLPEHFPAYERLLVDGEHLWIEEGHPPTASARTWWGFDARGRLHAQLSVPAALELYEITGTNGVLGKWTDAEGNESVRRYRLMRLAR